MIGTRRMKSPSVLWVALTSTDLDRVDEIAGSLHTGLPERTEVFAEKLTLFPAGCMKLVAPRGEMLGYGITHPWKLNSIPPLDEFLNGIPHDSNCLYVHDVAILSEARGQNASEKYIEKIAAIAKGTGISKLACVSVYGTDVLWEKVGFRIVDSAELAEKLATYGHTAKYMIANV
jgi:hypothetical protein